MKWITTEDLKLWPDKRPRHCQETMPILLRKLIYASCDKFIGADIPGGDSIAYGGYDGYIELHCDTTYLPEGKIVFEIGTEKGSIRNKADRDYNKRTKTPGFIKPSDTTYVFVTPRLFSQAKAWAAEKRKENIWKDVRVINASVFDSWLELHPPVAAWLAQNESVTAISGAESLDTYWNQRYIKENGSRIYHTLLTGNRKNEEEALFSYLKNYKLFCVSSSSECESISFIIAAFKNNPEGEHFLSKCLIVNEPTILKNSGLLNRKQIFIVTFNDIGIFETATKNGHTVIYPSNKYSNNDAFATIDLPKIDYRSFHLGLKNSGYTDERATTLSQSSFREVDILRKLEKFDTTPLYWETKENLEMLIPALLLGGWEESFEFDNFLLSHLANEAYETYVKSINSFINDKDAPIIKANALYKVKSPQHILFSSDHLITKEHLHRFRETCIIVFNEDNPVLKLKGYDRMLASIRGIRSETSHILKKNICQTLILFAVHNRPVAGQNGQLYVDSIITEILSTDNNDVWKSFSGYLEKFAEASPNAFLKKIKNTLENNDDVILNLFAEEKGISSPHSYQHSLLFGLECLAGIEKHFSDSVMCLAHLAQLDPGGSTMNRPIKHLVEIFSLRYPRTNVNVNDRYLVLSKVIDEFPEIGIQIILRNLLFFDMDMPLQLFTHRTSISLTPKSNEFGLGYPASLKILKELNRVLTPSHLIDLVTAWVKPSYRSTHDLIDIVKKHLQQCTEDKTAFYVAVARIISRHRAYSSANWAISEKDILTLEELLENQKTSEWFWLECAFLEKESFLEHPPDAGKARHSSLMNAIFEIQVKLLKSRFNKKDMKRKLLECSNLENQAHYGSCMAHVLSTKSDNLEFLVYQIRNEKYSAVYSFIAAKSRKYSIAWVLPYFNKLKSKSLPDNSLVHLFAGLDARPEIWKAVNRESGDFQKAYWESLTSYFPNLPTDDLSYGLRKLIQHERYTLAYSNFSFYKEHISSADIITFLLGISSGRFKLNHQIEAFTIRQFFKELYSRNDLIHNDIVQLEISYFDVFCQPGNEDDFPKFLKIELSTNANFFMELSCWVSKPDSQVEEDIYKPKTVEDNNRASKAFKILYKFRGFAQYDDPGSIDIISLSAHIEKLRQLAIEKNRIQSVDKQIGQVLGCYNKKGPFPPQFICEILENTASDKMLEGFTSGVRTGKTVQVHWGDGSERARRHSDYFAECAERIRYRFPMVAKALDEVSRDKLLSANHWMKKSDEEELWDY